MKIKARVYIKNLILCIFYKCKNFAKGSWVFFQRVGQKLRGNLDRPVAKVTVIFLGGESRPKEILATVAAFVA